MTAFFIQLYGNIDDLCNSRIIEELDYYMYDVRSKKEMIYYFTVEQTIFLVLSDDTIWTIDKLQVLTRTALRENSFVLIPFNNYRGYMNVWDKLNKTSEEFFNDPKTYRKSFKRANKLFKLKSLIKRHITKEEIEDEKEN